MAIKRRLRTDFWLVSRDDDAFDECPAIVSYARTYDFALLEPWLAEHPDLRPTKFRARALDAKWQRLVETLRAADLWEIFASHVTAVEDLLDEQGREIRVQLEGTGADRAIPIRYRDDGSIPMAVYTEIGMAIVHKGTTADNTPFGSQDTLREWQRTRGFRNHVRKADAALLLGFANAKTNPISVPSISESPAPSPESEPSTAGGA